MIRKYIAGLIAGQKIFFVVNGTTFGDPEQVVSRDLLPELPTAENIETSPWGSLGKLATSEPNITKTELEVIGCNDNLDPTIKCDYDYERITVTTYKDIVFTAQYIPQEALDLSYGLLASGENAYLEGWLYFDVIDTQSPAGEQQLATLAVYGRLSLTANLQGSNAVTTANWRFDIIQNPLATSFIKNLNS